MKVSEIADEIVSRIKTGEPFTVTNKTRMKLWIEEALLSVHDEAIKEFKKALEEKLRKLPIHGHPGYDDAYVHWELVLEAVRTLKLKKEA